MKKKTDKQIAMRVSAVSIIGNIALSVIKLLAGIVANSGAMISDAVHQMLFLHLLLLLDTTSQVKVQIKIILMVMNV